MKKEQLVKIVDEVAEGLLEGGPGSGRYPAGSGKNPESERATQGVARHKPGYDASRDERLKRRVAVGGPEHDDEAKHQKAYDEAPSKIKTKDGSTLYKAGWDNRKKKPIYVSVPDRED